MATYTVRIELHSNKYLPDFETLHRGMQQEGFSKLITADNGKIYHLPRGEYDISTVKTPEQVLSAANQAVQLTGQSAEILVSEAVSRTWQGLTEKK
ncbi:MAG: type V toxin-antitoxin system endoribonuclease antitoxin GhoS [bacterium]|nr:type V toxin-antitoxin system endoribonuclease antitoxin GhoS [bacterium]